MQTRRLHKAIESAVIREGWPEPAIYRDTLETRGATAGRGMRSQQSRNYPVCRRCNCIEEQPSIRLRRAGGGGGNLTGSTPSSSPPPIHQLNSLHPGPCRPRYATLPIIWGICSKHNGTTEDWGGGRGGVDGFSLYKDKYLPVLCTQIS